MTEDYEDMTREEALAKGTEAFRNSTQFVERTTDLFRKNIERLTLEGKEPVACAAILARDFFKYADEEPWEHDDLVGLLVSAIFKIINLEDNLAALSDGQHRSRE